MGTKTLVPPGELKSIIPKSKQIGLDWDILGFDPTSHENVKKHITYPSKYGAENAKSFDDDDFLLQIAAHENLLKSILS